MQKDASYCENASSFIGECEEEELSDIQKTRYNHRLTAWKRVTDDLEKFHKDPNVTVSQVDPFTWVIKTNMSVKISPVESKSVLANQAKDQTNVTSQHSTELQSSIPVTPKPVQNPISSVAFTKTIEPVPFSRLQDSAATKSISDLNFTSTQPKLKPNPNNVLLHSASLTPSTVTPNASILLARTVPATLPTPTPQLFLVMPQPTQVQLRPVEQLMAPRACSEMIKDVSNTVANISRTMQRGPIAKTSLVQTQPMRVTSTVQPSFAAQPAAAVKASETTMPIITDVRSVVDAVPTASQVNVPAPFTKDTPPPTSKTYPSLNVLVKPESAAPLRLALKKRQELDTLVKSKLVLNPRKFTEWLLQLGLLRSVQRGNCLRHAVGMATHPMQLGMATDEGKFPHSGGYVWIMPCCASTFTSVFLNSIFEAAPHPPASLVKLLYHWACQTSVHNVELWVKVDRTYLRSFYTMIRAVCTVSLHTRTPVLGSTENRRVEVGIISLGTTTTDGQRRDVKVEVLGIYDHSTKQMRLRACQPNFGEISRVRFLRILEPMRNWVTTEATILTDFTLDRGVLKELGFTNVIQKSLKTVGPNDSLCNRIVMDYLRRVVPRIFQSALSMLSLGMIQQFLDELVWRERCGTTSLDAFNNIISDISMQTRVDLGSSLMNRLASAAADPMKDWALPSHAVKAVESLVTPATVSKTVLNALSSPISLESTPKDNEKRSSSPVLAATGVKRKSEGAKTAPVVKKYKTGGFDSPGVATKPLPSRAFTPAKSSEKLLCTGVGTGTMSRVLGFSEDDDDETVGLAGSIAELPLSVEWSEAETGEIYQGETSVDSEGFCSFYGVLPGYPQLIEKARESPVTANCVIENCGAVSRDNMEAVEHLLGHALEQLVGYGKENLFCPYCIESASSDKELEIHVKKAHSELGAHVCEICEQNSARNTNLLEHLRNSHVPLELPYVCTVCKFRSSKKKDALDHFAEVHHVSGHLMCPMCLECFDATKSIQNMQKTFMGHLKEHYIIKSQLKKYNCRSCTLQFVTASMLAKHMKFCHESLRGTPGVRSYGPNLALAKSMSSTNNQQIFRVKPSIIESAHFIKRFPGMKVTVPPNMNCIECGQLLSSENHFAAYTCCTECNFTTCCMATMENHRLENHAKGIPSRCGPTFHISEVAVCVCGFQITDCNTMVQHIGSCEQSNGSVKVLKSESSQRLGKVKRTRKKD